MNLFGSNTKEISELKLALEESTSRMQELQKECEDYRQTIASFHMSTSKYDKEMETLKAKYEKEIKELKTQLTDVEKSVNKKVNKALQNVGVTSFLPEIPIPVANSDRELYDRFISMPNGKEKQEFFTKNEAAIKRALGM